MKREYSLMLIIIGALIVLIGLLSYVNPNMFSWLGKLPGDIRVEKENSRFYFPITSMLLVSAVLSLGAWLVRRFR